MELSTAEQVGLEVRVQMTRHGATQADLAEALHLSQQAVSRRLRGEIAFDVTELGLIAGLFHITAAALIPVVAA
jgi:transcriptional regulator with XRE-family HTH domain